MGTMRGSRATRTAFCSAVGEVLVPLGAVLAVALIVAALAAWGDAAQRGHRYRQCPGCGEWVVVAMASTGRQHWFTVARVEVPAEGHPHIWVFNPSRRIMERSSRATHAPFEREGLREHYCALQRRAPRPRSQRDPGVPWV